MTYYDLIEGRASIPLAPRALWKITGPDRLRFLNGQTTQDIAALRPGHAVHAAVTNAKGKMDAEIWVTAHDADALWIDAPPGLQDALTARLDRYLIADDARLEDVTGSRLIHHVLTSPPPGAIASARFLRPGHDLWLEPDQPPPLPPASPEAIETLRILQCIPLWGRDIGPEHLPPEAALDRDAISYRKGCYIGQEVLARIKSIGRVNKRLARLHSTATVMPALPCPIQHQGRTIGSLTSACPLPDQPGLIGLAVLPCTLADARASVHIADAPWQIEPLA